jgi:hypothetical protein
MQWPFIAPRSCSTLEMSSSRPAAGTPGRSMPTKPLTHSFEPISYPDNFPQSSSSTAITRVNRNIVSSENDSLAGLPPQAAIMLVSRAWLPLWQWWTLRSIVAVYAAQTRGSLCPWCHGSCALGGNCSGRINNSGRAAFKSLYQHYLNIPQ